MAQASQAQISADKLYLLESFKSLTGLGDCWMRNARRRGLRVHRVGGRAFVLGRDFIEFVQNAGANLAPKVKAAR